MDKIKEILEQKNKKDYTLSDLYYSITSNINNKFTDKELDISVNTDLSVFESLLFNENYIRDYFDCLEDYNDYDSNYLFLVLPIMFTKINSKNSIDEILNTVKDCPDIETFVFRSLYKIHNNYLGEEGYRTNADCADLLVDNNLSEFCRTINPMYSKKIPKHILEDKRNSFTDKYYKGISYCVVVIEKKEYVNITEEIQNFRNAYSLYKSKSNKVEEIIELTLNDNPNYHKVKHLKNKLVNKIQDLIQDYNNASKEYDKLIQDNIHKNITKDVVTLFNSAAYNLEKFMSGYNQSEFKTVDKTVLNELMEEEFGGVEEQPELEPIVIRNPVATSSYSGILTNYLDNMRATITNRPATLDESISNTNNADLASLTFDLRTSSGDLYICSVDYNNSNAIIMHSSGASISIGLPVGTNRLSHSNLIQLIVETIRTSEGRNRVQFIPLLQSRPEEIIMSNISYRTTNSQQNTNNDSIEPNF